MTDPLHADLLDQPGSRARLNTPALVLDLDALDANIAAMRDLATRGGVALRPHAKTHKSTDIARRQIAAGAAGQCCAKLGEAEALAEAGIAAADLMAWLPHQANARIIDKVGANLGLGGVEWLGALAQYGNSSAATMPLALSLRMGREPALPGGPVLLSAFGAGTIWGAAVWQHRP